MNRFARRALLRAAVSAGVAAAAAGPARRSGGSVRIAALSAAFTAALFESPPIGAALAVGALAIGAPRANRHRAGAAASTAAGVAVATAVRRVWPVPPRTPAEVRRGNRRVGSRPSPEGEGVTIVVNASAGGSGDGVADAIRERLPRALVLEAGEGDDLGPLLERAASADIVGIAGGDGSINAAAAVAAERQKPLLVIPAGTLNHFARDLGVNGLDDAVDALRDGDTVAVDTGVIDGRPFLNTASFGTYSDLVDARERLESTIGKWPALVVALGRMLREAQPVEVEIDGRRRRLWMVFIGNCAYSPPGFAPAWRERLDDRQLDVRLVDAGSPFARARLLAAVLTGRLARTAVYEAFCTTQVHVRSLDGPLRLARDGETFDGGGEFDVVKGPPVAVYAPLSGSERSRRPT